MPDEHYGQRLSGSEVPGGSNTTIMFLDLTSFTALNDSHGDDTAVAIVDLFVDAVEYAVRGRGRVVKTLGDGVLLQVGNPAAAVEVAHQVSALLHDHDRARPN